MGHPAPLATAAFSEPASPAAWHTIPSWYLLASQDNTVPPKTQACMAERAWRHGHPGALLARRHAVAPEKTTNLILRAAKSVE